MCPMWENDIIYGGEQLEPNVHLDEQEYVLWDCAIVAENVHTSLGDDGTKVEVVISALREDPAGRDPLTDPPAKYGTFASSIVGKVRQKADGDLPAVIVFSKVPSSQAAGQDAFVMTFRRPWAGDPSTMLPPITPVREGSSSVPAAETTKRIDVESGRYYTTIGGRKVLGDPAPAKDVKAAAKVLKDEADEAIKDLA